MNAKDRFLSRKWGVFNHFIEPIQNNPKILNSYGKTTDWNTLVNEFDVELVAKTLNEIGAGYYVFTVMQGTKHMVAPNKTFDKIAGTKPGEACSHRDLIEDLYQALKKYDIDLFLYFTGDGPYKNHPEGDRFGFVEPRHVGVTKDFVEKWASVLEEYAVRYGDKVKGWWIDGCYKIAHKYTDELLEIFYKACKKGNPNALVAMNGGDVQEGDFCLGYINDDFLCGEQGYIEKVPKKRFYGSAQAHTLIPIGVTPQDGSMSDLIQETCCPGWGCFVLIKPKEFILDFVKRCNEVGAVVSIDIGVYRDGKYDPIQVEALKYLNENL